MIKRLSFLILFFYSGLAWSTPVEVILHGVQEAQEKNIREGLSILDKSQKRDLTPEQIEVLHRRAPDEIQDALEPFGYYHATVQAQLITDQDPIQAIYTITLNEPTRVDALDLELSGRGKTNPDIQYQITQFPLKQGDVFDHLIYEEGKVNLQQDAINAGYVKAFFSQKQVLVDLSQKTADIHLTLDTGPLYHFGDVRFSESYYHPTFLKRFVTFDQTTPYTIEEIVGLENKLMQSNLFSSVHALPDLEGTREDVPVGVQLKEAKANRYTVGVGYDTNTRARAKLGWQRRKVNRWGHQFQSHFKISEKDTLMDAAYTIPGKKPWVDQYKIAGAYADEEYKDRPSQLFTLELSETREIFSWQRTLALRYLKENFVDSDGVGDISHFLLPSLRLNKTKVDDFANPRNGYRVGMTLRGGMNALLSDRDFAQVHLEGRVLKALGESGTIIARAELGATFPRDIEDLPLSIRFYAGGIDSLRGFRYRSLPREYDEQGRLQPVGGAYLILGSLEYDHTLYGPLKWAVFADGGGALRKVDDPLQAALGVGLRWDTPVGPLKLDVAKPVTNAAKVWRLHFSFGPQL